MMIAIVTWKRKHTLLFYVSEHSQKYSSICL